MGAATVTSYLLHAGFFFFKCRQSMQSETSSLDAYFGVAAFHFIDLQ